MVSTYNTSVSSLLADNIVQKMKDKSYKIVAFDFDQTIVNIHTFFAGVNPTNVHERSLKEDFADIELFQEVVRKLQQNQIKVAVASFGYKAVIEAYLAEIFPNDSKEITILSRENDLTKSKMLKLLAKELNDEDLNKNQVVLFDDDAKNCKQCRKEGYDAVEVETRYNGLSKKFWKEWIRSEKQ